MRNLPAIENVEDWLSFSVDQVGDRRIYRMDVSESHIGNPLIRAIHGGVVATFLETAAKNELEFMTGTAGGFRAINSNVDFLKSSNAARLFAAVQFSKIGRRVAVVDIISWQASKDAPVAKACCSFSISDSGRSPSLTVA